LLLLLLLRESCNLRHEHALTEGVEARRLGLKLLLLLLGRDSELRLLGRREATAEGCESRSLRLELHRYLLLTEGRWLLCEELRLLGRETGLLLLETSGEGVEGGLLLEVGRSGTESGGVEGNNESDESGQSGKRKTRADLFVWKGEKAKDEGRVRSNLVMEISQEGLLNSPGD